MVYEKSSQKIHILTLLAKTSLKQTLNFYDLFLCFIFITLFMLICVNKLIYIEFYDKKNISALITFKVIEIKLKKN